MPRKYIQITYQPIGIIHSPFTSLEQMPVQPTNAASAPGTIEIFPEFAAGLQDLAGFSHIYLLYHLHQVHQARLLVTPFLDSLSRGVFATRAPVRPNPIGLSLVELQRIEGSTLHVNPLDALDGTPLLDIKPYIPEFEEPQNVRIGWLAQAKKQMRSPKSDNRFK